MARTVDLEAHAERRRSFLEAAARLLERKGFERMTVQDVLDDVGQSKGAFYHYFESKQDLVEALIQTMGGELCDELERRLEGLELSAPEKLMTFVSQSSSLKLERKRLWAALLPIWVQPGNAAIRDRMTSQTQARMAPVLAQIVRDGVAEGSFTNEYPDQAARMVFALAQDLNALTMRLLSTPGQTVSRTELEQACDGYNDAVERLLGAPSGSIRLVEPKQLTVWLEARNEASEAAPVAAGV